MSWKCCIFSFWRFCMHGKYHSPISPQSSSIEVHLNKDSFRSISGVFLSEWVLRVLLSSSGVGLIVVRIFNQKIVIFLQEQCSTSVTSSKKVGVFLLFFKLFLLLLPSPWILKISVYCSAMSQRFTLWHFQWSFEPHTLSVIKQSSLSKKLSPSTDDWTRTEIFTMFK